MGNASLRPAAVNVAGADISAYTYLLGTSPHVTPLPVETVRSLMDAGLVSLVKDTQGNVQAGFYRRPLRPDVAWTDPAQVFRWGG